MWYLPFVPPNPPPPSQELRRGKSVRGVIWVLCVVESWCCIHGAFVPGGIVVNHGGIVVWARRNNDGISGVALSFRQTQCLKIRRCRGGIVSWWYHGGIAVLSSCPTVAKWWWDRGVCKWWVESWWDRDVMVAESWWVRGGSFYGCPTEAYGLCVNCSHSVRAIFDWRVPNWDLWTLRKLLSLCSSDCFACLDLCWQKCYYKNDGATLFSAHSQKLFDGSEVSFGLWTDRFCCFARRHV